MAKKQQTDDIDFNDILPGKPESLVPLTEGGELAIPMAEAHGVSLSDMARGLAAGDLALEQVLILNVGQGVEGELIGRGGEMEVNAPQGATKDNPSGKNMVKTWRVRVYDRHRQPTNIVAILLSSAPLESQLPGKEGKLVGIVRLPKVDIGSRRVNRYAVYEILNK